ncbi:hypothetical protein [Streptomyces sp. Da 82-17]|uniref:hypothetical protein n=1 Tax=Streptomyces sp. Da 82-17 TaxID=3377116 RepID=UPI0038D3B65A
MTVRYEITAPTTGHTGLVAGVPFVAGRAVVDDPPPGALLYFRRHGYTINPDGERVPAGFVANGPSTPPKPARPRSKPRGTAKDTADEG